MKSITSKFKIVQNTIVLKSVFNNKELTYPVKTKFICSNCNKENEIEIFPYSSGFPLFQLYNGNKYLTKDELIKNGIATKTSKWMEHFGEVTFNDLPTLYFTTKCESCNSNFLCVFSCGEKQPGFESLQISGVWQFEFK